MNLHLDRQQKIKEHFKNPYSGNYLEYDDKGDIIYLQYQDGDWSECDYFKDQILYRYKDWRGDNMLGFMNIICK